MAVNNVIKRMIYRQNFLKKSPPLQNATKADTAAKIWKFTGGRGASEISKQL
jgi:hypothetical protein